jgi:predicted branched-subunit amino acid permease
VSNPNSSEVRNLWVLVSVLFPLLVGLVTGVVKHATGAGVAETVLTGGSAFAGSMVLCLGVLAVLHQFEH